MSFILDALKKSDKKRQDGNVPSLVTAHTTDAVSNPQRPRWALLLGLLLTVNAAILLWLFGPWSEPQQAAQRPVAPAIFVERKSPAEPAPPIAVKGSSAAVIGERSPAPNVESPQPATAAVSGGETLTASAGESADQNAAAPLAMQLAQAVTKTAPLPKADVVPAAALEQAPRLYELSDLPPAVRRDIPEMHIDLHAYYPDDVQKRLVSINHKLLREGGVMSGKYHLEEITADGVIFRYAGYRFQVRLKRS